MASSPRIGILVVAFNAASTLRDVLDRIPVSFRPRITQVLVSDDASHDATYLVGLGYQQVTDLPLTVIRQDRNLGYGGNQKAGYRWAIEHDLDVVVLLHGDGQYAPELLPEMVAPLERGDADAVLGSRMIARGAARRGGMPLYKLVGNRILTRFQNRVTGRHLSEWHSGYRAYAVSALREIPFEANTDGFAFDTEVIVQLLEAEQRVVEIPIPTYYGDEISHVNGLSYAWDISRHVVRYRLHKMGFGSGELAFSSGSYEEKTAGESSHGLIARRLERRAPGRILDLGCGAAPVTRRLRDLGWEVTGVDIDGSADTDASIDRFIKADLDEGLPPEVGSGYDVVLAADVLEHLRGPERLLVQLRDVVAPGGVLLTSVPNFGHWYVRGRVLLGRFDYDRRGILDRGHLRFFTRRSFAQLAQRSGWRITGVQATGLPLEISDRGVEEAEPEGGRARGVARRMDSTAVKLWPALFAYQFLFELEPVTRRA